MLRPAWSLALAVVFALAMTTLLQSGSTVRAQEPDSNSGSQPGAVPPPPGNCWGGALSESPVHCFALEQAQRDGIIEVEGIYRAEYVINVFFNYPRMTVHPTS